MRYHFNSRDKEKVLTIAKQLQVRGLKVWFDDWIIRYGDDIYLSIEQGLAQSRTLILFMSPHAFDSDWVGLERSTAIFRDPANRNKRFLPVLLTDCEIPDPIHRFKHFDLREFSPKLFTRLANACRSFETSDDDNCTNDDDRTKPTDISDGLQKYFDEVLEELYQKPIVMMLAQESMADGPIGRPLLERARERFGGNSVLPLSLPIGDNETAFFESVAHQLGFSTPIQDPNQLQNTLAKRLDTSDSLFLLVQGFERCSDKCGHSFAGMLRSLYDTKDYANKLYTIILGGRKLAAMKYANPPHSFLNIAETSRWPELNAADIIHLQQQWFPELSLSNSDAKDIQSASGGHPKLIRHCLQQYQQADTVDVQSLINSDTAAELWGPLLHHPEKQRLCELLSRDDLGSAPPYLFDSLLNSLYWRNLLIQREQNQKPKIFWRCKALQTAGKSILECD